jgi:hypothetical protein
MQSAQKSPKNPLFALEKFLKILIKFICSKVLSFCYLSSYLLAVLLQQEQIQEEFMLILGEFQGFQGPWGGFNFIFFLEVVLSPQGARCRG